jgi:hypothetical protein
MPFELTLSGKVYNTHSLSLEESDQLEKECAKTWLELNPVRSSAEFRATARVFLTRDHDPAGVELLLAAFTIQSAMAAVEWVDDDLPDVFEDGLPKAEGGPSTTTSSGSPALPTDGHPTSPAANGSGTSSSSSSRLNKAG